MSAIEMVEPLICLEPQLQLTSPQPFPVLAGMVKAAAQRERQEHARRAAERARSAAMPRYTCD